jgi:hypothetical protein
VVEKRPRKTHLRTARVPLGRCKSSQDRAAVVVTRSLAACFHGGVVTMRCSGSEELCRRGLPDGGEESFHGR